MKVGKRGNGLAVRIPANVVRSLGLNVGDEIEVLVTNPRSFEIRKVAGADIPKELGKRANSSSRSQGFN